MTKIVIDVPKKYDIMLDVLKMEKEYPSKAVVASKIIEKFFEKNYANFESIGNSITMDFDESIISPLD